MELRDAYESLKDGHAAYARFYGPAEGLDVGVGVILDNVAYPTFDDTTDEFVVAEGLAYVVSHECDIAQENDRPLNNSALVCPIIPLSALLESLRQSRTADQIRGFVDGLARSEVDRAAYIPTIADVLPDGGVLCFGAVSSTDVKELVREGVQSVCAVTLFGLQYVDQRLHQAILKRPKSQLLPLARVR